MPLDADAQSNTDLRGRARISINIPKLVLWGCVLMPPVGLILASSVVGWWLLPVFVLACIAYAAGLRAWADRGARAGVPARTGAEWGDGEDAVAAHRAKRVCVVGAGPVGLCAVKELREQGHEVVCIEEKAALGGVFRAASTRPQMPLTSSPHVTAFSDFPESPDRHRHWTCSEFGDYLDAYMEAHRLMPHLRFGVEMVRIAHRDNAFVVTVRHADSGETEDLTDFDHVALCTGVHRVPVKPHYPGLERFTGEVVHARDFVWDADGTLASHDLRGKKVAVVGFGESAADVAASVLDFGAAHCMISVRDATGGAFVIPRVNPRTNRNNDYDTNRLRNALPKWLHNFTVLGCTWLNRRFLDLESGARVRANLLLSSRKGPLRQFATKSDLFMPFVLDGRCRFKPEIVEFLDDGQIRFSDGTVEAADVLLFCTGYRPQPIEIDGSDFPFEPNPAKRYLRMFDPAWGSAIAFLGAVRPAIGSIPTAAELQARLFALVVSGRRHLPDRDRMCQDIKETRSALTADFGPGWNEKITNWIPFMDRLASEIGCRPPLSLWWRDPKLAFKLVVGPATGYQYRLAGPGARPEQARRILMALPVGMEREDLVLYAALHAYAIVASVIVPWSVGSRHTRCSLY